MFCNGRSLNQKKFVNFIAKCLFLMLSFFVIIFLPLFKITTLATSLSKYTMFSNKSPSSDGFFEEKNKSNFRWNDGL